MTSHQLALVRTAMTADDRLDDLARVRIWNGLAESLAAGNDNASHAEPDRHRRHRTIAIATTASIAAAALAAAIAFIVLRPSHSPRASTVAAETTLTLPLGPYARAAVVGPARFELVTAAAAAPTVRVDAGVLLAELDGGPGRSLRIIAPHVTVDVIGTLFAVDVRSTETCVSVEHGTVRLSWSDRPPLALTGGNTYCTASGAQPIAPATRDALLRHERVITASREAELAPAAVAPTTSRPAPAPAAVATPTISQPSVAPIAVAPTISRQEPAPIAVATPTVSQPSVAPIAVATPTISSAAAAPRSRAASKPPASHSESAATVPSQASATAPSPPAATAPSQPTTTSAATPIPTSSTSIASTKSDAQTAAATSNVTVTPKVTPDTPAAGTPDDLYREAEAALVRRDQRAADRVLARLVTQHPQSPLVEQALYDRARIAYQQRAWSAARKHLDQLLALPSPRLVEQARYLECRIAVDTHDDGAVGCLDSYRDAYPRSPHAADVLAMLVQLAHADGGCGAAAARITELVAQHPKSKLAAAWRARCPEKR